MLHSKQALAELATGHRPEDVEGLGDEEAGYIEGVLNIGSAKIEDMMTHKSKVNLHVALDDVLDEDLVYRLRENGFTRVPIVFSHDHKNLVVGILLIKSLIGLKLD